MMLQGGMGSLRFNLGKLLRWWWSEMAALIPASVRRSFSWRQSEFWLTCSEGQIEAFRAASGLSQAVALKQVLKQKTVLLLPDELCLLRQAELPLAVEANLAQVVGFELDRLTPMTPTQAYYDYRVVAHDLRRRVLTVEILLCPRPALARQLRLLAEQGLVPDQVTRMDQDRLLPLPFNLLPKAQLPRLQRLPQWINGTLGGLVVVLLGVWLIQPLRQAEQQLAELQPALREAKAGAEATRKLKQQIGLLEQDGAFLQQLQGDHVAPLELLRELTQILADDTWLQQLQLRGDELLIQGQAPAAAQVVQILESSPLLREVSFRSPVVRDVQSGHESFFLSARLGETRP